MKKKQVTFNPQSAILSLCGDVSKVLKYRGNRQLLLIEGTFETVTIVQEQLQTLPFIRVCMLPNLNSSANRTHQIHALLGKEFDTILFDAQIGFDAELFAACSGTLVAGGSLIIVTPSLDVWPEQHDQLYQQLLGTDITEKNSPLESVRHSLYLQRFVRIIRDRCIPIQGFAHGFRTQRSLDQIGASTEDRNQFAPKNASEFSVEPWRKEQQAIITELVAHINSHNSTISVVMADRGRGKSALAGQAVAEILKGDKTVAVTANLIANVSVLHSHCARALEMHEGGSHATPLLESESADSLPFYAIDRIEEWSGDVLIVEEAGSIPLPILMQMVDRLGQDGQHIVFVTTVHGYEGAGRSFAIQFKRWLDAHKRTWRLFAPTLPVRWHRGDSVEALTNELALLSLPDTSIPSTIDRNNVECRKVRAEELIQDESLLREIYSLLSQAHYQTTPNDLRHLLDQPSMTLFVLTARDAREDCPVIGVALLATEGEIETQLHEAVVGKSRRLHNQLLPQLLAQCINSRNVLGHSFQRIIRIAIHPDCQRQGFGSQLLKAIARAYSSESVTLGASFGATEELLTFWLNAGYKLIHFGHRRNSRSGLRSACLVRDTQSTLQASIQFAQKLFKLNQQSLLSFSMTADAPGTTQTNDIFERCQRLALSNDQDEEEISSEFGSGLLERFINGERNFSDTAWALENFLNNAGEQVRDGMSRKISIGMAMLSQWSLAGSARQRLSSRREAEAELKTWLIENRRQ